MFVKFCGFTQPKDVKAACKLGVSACGFVFYSASKRFCNFLIAKECISICKEYNVLSVGVFVETPPHDILSLAQILQLDACQIYSEDAYVQLSPYYTILFGVRINSNSLHQPIPLMNSKKDYLLFDTFDSFMYGGTGKQFNWDILKSFSNLDRIIIAGGINSNNLPHLFSKIVPYGIDISSGIEDAPGKKNILKMKAIIATIKELGHDISR